jgi:hypothetical protein
MNHVIQRRVRAFVSGGTPPVLIGCVAVCLLLPALWAQEPAEKKTRGEKEAAQERYEGLVREYEQAVTDRAKAFQQAKTDVERKSVLKMPPLPPRVAAGMLKLAEDYPKQPAALDAIVWIVRNASSSPESQKALEVFTRDHAKKGNLESLCLSLAASGSEDGARLLRIITTANPHKEVKARASLSLAQCLMRSPHARSRKEAEDILEAVQKDYADVLSDGKKTLGEAAKGLLFELRNLQIGMTAPEIEGADIDGKKFKLSDYRGKVVVLHFWGSW